MTVFGTPVEVTLSELALETFFPADAATATALRAAGDARDTRATRRRSDALPQQRRDFGCSRLAAR